MTAPSQFRPTSRARKTRKSVVTFGTYGGEPAVLKQLLGKQRVWRWYLAQEIGTYQRFAAEPPPWRVPRMLAADEAAGWLLLEQIEGAALGSGRRSDTTEVGAIVELQRALRDYPARALPSSPVRRALQSRFLEDASDPIGWITHGLERAVSRKLLPAAVAQAAIDVIVSYGEVRFAHGDLLPRNIIMTPEGPVLVDWECAGPMLSSWDPALLYISIPATRDQLPRSAVLHATVLFALARELAFLHAFPGGSSRRYEQLRREIAEASAKLVE